MSSSSLGWTLAGTHPTPTHGRVFQRPLDVHEHALFWDGRFDGTADNIRHVQLRLVHGAQDAHLLTASNIVRAWLSTKRRYPLAGAIVHAADPPACGGGTLLSTVTPHPHFVVREDDLAVLCPQEIVFGQVEDAAAAQGWVTATLNGPRSLSDALLVRLYVFREAARADVLHLMAVMAHCVTDGVGNNTFMRCLVDTLARGGRSGSGVAPAQIPLEERLAMAIPSQELRPRHLRMLSPARRRWRSVVGVVIFKLRAAKIQASVVLADVLDRFDIHSVGWTYTSMSHDALDALRCRTVSSHLYPAYTCRDQNCDGQLSFTLSQHWKRLSRACASGDDPGLYRRYLRGEISEEEWTYRKRQPHLGGTPVSLRPYLDKEWFGRSGGGAFMVSVSFALYTLPFMTLGTAGRHRHGANSLISPDGAPPFSELLAFDRFLHRAGLLKRRIATFSKHPLFYEIAHAASLVRTEHSRERAMRWMQRNEASADPNDTQKNTQDDKVLAAMDMPMVLAHVASSLGDLDSRFPSEYPLPRTHPLSPDSFTPHPMKAGYVTSHPEPDSPSDFETGAGTLTPSIVVETSTTYLHACPAELYLGAATWREQMNMHVFYDGNVFEDEVVKEWLDEVRGAVLWYLGQTHWALRSATSEPGVQAKL